MSKNRMCLGDLHHAVKETTHVLILLKKCLIFFQMKEIQQNQNNSAENTSPTKNDHITYSSNSSTQTPVPQHRSVSKQFRVKAYHV